LIDPEVWRWVDRLIFDSRCWREPRGQFTALREAIRSSRTVLCDLNWMRTLHLRQALAQMFDNPDGIAALGKLSRVAITHAPGARTTALLLLGWLAAQLGWTGHGPAGRQLTFTADDSNIACELIEAAGPAISRISLEAGMLHILAEHQSPGTYLRISVNWRDGRSTRHLLPGDSEELTDILDEELASGGRHRIYLKALATAESLL
jgi:glucose-6-phosphate dehydrogenase assembly protein OpcA